MAYDVVALGELLIDFTQNGLSEQGNQLFEANPGGAPCNVLSMLCRFGHTTAFIGKVGDDMFGKMLASTITSCGISDEALLFDPEVNTTLAFVHKLASGDRDFSFYRNPGADMMLRADEVPEQLIAEAKVFHFGSLSMTSPQCVQATQKALSVAEKNGVLRSFDPNLRPPLWRSLEEAKAMIRYGLAHCDVLKISDNEIQWLTGEEDYTAGVEKIREVHSIPLILVSMGPHGSRAYTEHIMVEQPARLTSDTVETTGAGDAFCACVLHDVLENGLVQLTEERLSGMLRAANVAASLVTTRRGALRVMPTVDEIFTVLHSITVS
ncbi:carbohydrate kinase [Eubacteriales bacterium OttesenSCG-928-N13]|nr:carbohydrate kinase [Eubacteriales bacterium OttesenSCG-928-N13]